MTILILLIDAAVLGGLAWWRYRNQPTSLSGFYWPALILKMVAGMGVGVLYFYYYGGGDTTVYWRDSTVISDNLRAEPIRTIAVMLNSDWAGDDTIPGIVYHTDRAIFFVKILGVIALLCGNNYWMMSAVLSFISFLAAWYLFRTITERLPASRISAAVAFLFFPPIVFWSSGLIKESLGLASVYFLAGIFLRITSHKKLNAGEWLLAILFLWIGWRLKYYWLAVFLLTTISVVIVVSLQRKYRKLSTLTMPLLISVVIVLSAITTLVHPNFYPDRLLPMIWENNNAFMEHSAPEHAMRYHGFSSDFIAMLINSPTALVGGFFRPFIWETFNLVSFAAGIANLLMLVTVLSALPGLKRLSSSQNSLLVIATLFYCVVLAIFLALSTPNFGTLDRYRVGFSPFLLFLALFENPFLKKLTSKNDSAL